MTSYWKTSAALLAILLLLVLIAGCASQTQAPAQPTQPEPSPAPAQPTPSVTGPGMMRAPEPAPIKTPPVPAPEPPTKKITDQVNATDPTLGVDKTQNAIAYAVADGMHEKMVTYMRPGGSETIDVKVDVKNGIVTAASLAGNGTSPISRRMMEVVDQALPGLVVGKKITELSFPYQVSGSSLTAGAVKHYLDALAAGNAN